MIQSRNELKDIFVDGSYPDQQDVHSALNSYVHKDDLIPADRIENLQDLMQNEAETAAQAHACRPCSITIDIRDVDTASEMETYAHGDMETQQCDENDGEQEQGNGENNEEQQGDDPIDDPIDDQGDAPVVITFDGPDDLADRVIAVFADGLLLLPSQYAIDTNDDGGRDPLAITFDGADAPKTNLHIIYCGCDQPDNTDENGVIPLLQ